MSGGRDDIQTNNGIGNDDRERVESGFEQERAAMRSEERDPEAEIAEAPASLPQVQVLEEAHWETISDQHYRSFCLPCAPFDDRLKRG
ncbi:MAG: hypothetical protein AB8C02_01220 [Halioglobus sp.]